jgi:phospholipid/cholesterol/gamma-HCH transport system ATP-binding protein
MDNSRPLIEVRNVRITLGGRKVLDGLTFDVRRGEVFVVIGYSGSGKSVTIQCITGLLTPEAGSIRVGGEQIIGMPESELERVRRKFGYLFQSGALINWMTVAENVELPIREHSSMSAKRRRDVVRDKLTLVGLEKDGGKYPAEISGGMRKRAAMARAIALDPEVLLLDEPTSGLDPVLSAQIDQLTLDINRKLGITCLVVTHDMTSAQELATRVGFFREGKMHAVGTPAEILGSKDPEVVRFVTGGRATDPSQATPAAGVPAATGART